MELGQQPKTPSKCIVYWDYDNLPIPYTSTVGDVLCPLKNKILAKIGKKIPIECNLYANAWKLTPKIKADLDVNGVQHINITSSKPEAVDKRILIDIPLELYEQQSNQKQIAMALITSDKDFGHLLSRIHNIPEITHLILILINKIKYYCNRNLLNNVDHVIVHSTKPRRRRRKRWQKKKKRQINENAIQRKRNKVRGANTSIKSTDKRQCEIKKTKGNGEQYEWTI